MLKINVVADVKFEVKNPLNVIEVFETAEHKGLAAEVCEVIEHPFCAVMVFAIVIPDGKFTVIPPPAVMTLAVLTVI